MKHTTSRFWTAIAGWTISYFEPTYGMREFVVRTWSERNADVVWLDAGGYMYTITEIPK